MSSSPARYSRSLDWVTIGIYALMVGLGWLNVYAASYSPDAPLGFAGQSFQELMANNWFKQIIWIGTAVVLMVILVVVDYKAYDTFAYVFYAVVVLLLLVTLFIARPIAGSRSWLELGPVRLQPAEFAKFATALAVSRFMAGINLRHQNWRDQAVLAGMTLLPPLLIIASNETGQALVFGAFLLAYFREGMSPLILIVLAAAGVILILALLIPKLWLIGGITLILGGVFLVNSRVMRHHLPLALSVWAVVVGMVFGVDFFFNQVLQPHQRKRIEVLINPSADPLGVGWNVTQSKIAIGSGGLMGKGFLEGTQTKFDFVPEQSTDFIFCTVGEEWGWMGSIVVIILFMALLMRLVYVAERQKSVFGRTYGYCVASIFFFHFAVNVGMTIGLAPVVGIPLPLFSYGGSSLWSFTILLFIMLAIDAYRKQDLVR
ncbi:rod shape-determining protein RodA [Hymenobacter qilianensis]|uniref:Cell wall polymerase n=2 Tax=Hymenobacter qilianensis TaxID=1385715 RepID=A0A7H0GX97_9BACT|nr:rod shape-determining protein RodA [Hymenobacter qilianensis]QNP52913.1 rod shape-determining protein RodA [Hymenobacter qilianensis]GGF71758.1 rod shape-determining protein RodA [Hymenobacter qilianensis]